MSELIEASRSNKPAVLLDLDGVLQVFSEYQAPDFIHKPRDFWMSYNPAHGDWLQEVSQQADCYYISDWQNRSHAMLGQLLEVPEYEWIDSYKYKGSTSEKKRIAAIDSILAKRPIAWLDDDLSNHSMVWAQNRTHHEAPTLLIKPEEHLGLQPQHMKAVSAWLGQLAAQ